MNEKQWFSFPKDFWWGGAMSGPQTEGGANQGGKGPSTWDYWYQQEPERFFNKVGPSNTSNFYYFYKEDIQRMKEFKHNSHRTSIQWSRLIPDGDGEVNEQAVSFYNRVIDEMLANDIEPFMNLFHFDMPMAMQERGGFENREVVEAFARYAKICFDNFGDRVNYWFTFNEPFASVEGGYLYERHYPNVVDGERAAQVSHNMLIAHCKAVQEYRSANQHGQIGIILNITPTYPRTYSNKYDVQAAHHQDLIYNRSFLDPVVLGDYPEDLKQLMKDQELNISVEDQDKQLIKENTVDFLALNYYSPRRAKLRENAVHPQAPFMPEHLFDDYEMPGRKMNPYRGWEIYERALYDMAINIRDNYKNIPFIIGENGMGVADEERFRGEDGRIEDSYRIEFLQEHLAFLHKAIEEGANCKGYHMWAFMDCWSWINAYKNRYGFFEVDLNNDFKRKPKSSAYWFKHLIENEGFSI